MARLGNDAAREDQGRARLYRDAIVRFAAANQIRPAFVAAIGSRETRWNSVFFLGDIDLVTKIPHGYGPMQIDDRSFPSWTARYAKGELTATDGIEMGCFVIVQKRRALFGPHGLLTGIAAYSGEFMEQCVAAAYNSGQSRVAQLVLKGQDPDTRTTGKDYGRDVIARAAYFAANGFASA